MENSGGLPVRLGAQAGLRSGSDIDVLVTFEPEAQYGLFDIVRMEDELKEILGRDVDLIDRKSVEESRNYVRRHEVLETLETIYVQR